MNVAGLPLLKVPPIVFAKAGVHHAAKTIDEGVRAAEKLNVRFQKAFEPKPKSKPKVTIAPFIHTQHYSDSESFTPPTLTQSLPDTSRGVKKRHLNQLPIKSKRVAPGDVVGGLIYLMDKPSGIESGHVGLSMDSPAYRAWILEQLMQLKQNAYAATHPALQQRFATFLDIHQGDLNRLKNKDELIDALLHDRDLLETTTADKTLYKNVGMGGLLLEKYQQDIGVDLKEKFYPADPSLYET